MPWETAESAQPGLPAATREVLASFAGYYASAAVLHGGFLCRTDSRGYLAYWPTHRLTVWEVEAVREFPRHEP